MISAGLRGGELSKNNPALTLLFYDDDASYYLYPHPRAKRGQEHHYLSNREVKVMAA